jgi:ABC-type Na+ efflux pump permease subunit
MNRRAICAVIRRDLAVAAGSKAVVLPAIMAPLVLLVVLPAVAGIVPQLVGEAMMTDLEPVLASLPAGVVEGLPEDPGLRASQIVLTHLLTPLVLLVPIMLATVIAADGLAGEKERGTLEGLLLTPLSDQDLATAKLLAAWLPAVVLGVLGAVAYAAVANAVVGTQVGRLVLPTVEFAVMVLWVGPAMAAAGLGAVSLVSARVQTTQEAFQIGGVVVLPVVALLVSQAVGALLLSTWLLVAVGVVALLGAGALLSAASRSLSRPRLGEQLR